MLSESTTIVLTNFLSFQRKTKTNQKIKFHYPHPSKKQLRCTFFLKFTALWCCDLRGRLCHRISYKYPLQISAAHLQSSFQLTCLGKQWNMAHVLGLMQVGDPDEVLCSWLQPGLVPPVMATWETIQQIENFLCLSLCLSNKYATIAIDKYIKTKRLGKHWLSSVFNFY